MSDECLKNARPGATFQVFATAGYDLAKLRADIRQKTGFEPHIQFRLGPSRLTKNEQGGDVLNCEIVAIDDQVLGLLAGVSIPAPGYSLYVGHLKEPEAAAPAA